MSAALADLLTVALHEAGHAVVATALNIPVRFAGVSCFIRFAQSPLWTVSRHAAGARSFSLLWLPKRHVCSLAYVLRIIVPNAAVQLRAYL